MASTQQTYAKILGVVLTLVGLVGFFWNPVLTLFSVNTLHNVIHLLTGVIGLVVGFGSSTKNAQTFNRVFGVLYLLVAVLGLLAGTFIAGLLATNTADHVLHILIAVVTLGVGFGAKD